MDVAAWLQSLGLQQYEPAFRENAVDAEVLPQLTADDLKELGVVAVGHRRKLLAAIAVLREAAATTAPVEAPKPALSEGAEEEEGERRQVAVLFADLTGYTRLSRELDAEALHDLLDSFFVCADRIVEEHGGHIDKHIGDCVMAVFGAPVAHGNDPERAVSAALAIRAAMAGLSAELGRPIAVHTGVAFGEVVASGTGGVGHRAYTVTGLSVNLASRLADAAGPQAILVSDLVMRALEGRLDCSDAGTLTVKGFNEPVRAWRLEGLRAVATATRPFVGRRAELQQFQVALAACRETNVGRTIYIRGEAGIGKSRLAEEFREAARAAGFSCHTGLVLDFGTGIGRDAIRTIVRGLVGLDVTSPPEAARAAADEALADGLVSPEHAVFLNDLLDLPQPLALRALYDAMDNAARNRGKRETVAALVRRASARQPLMLVLEDLHWADQLMLAHAAELAAVTADHPVVLVLTSRVEGDPLGPAWHAATRGAALVTIDLGPLRREEALALARTFKHADERLAEACVERSGGHVLFLEQLLRSAEEGGLAEVPASIRSVVLARMDALPPHERRALRAASVLGQRFDLAALRHLLADPDYICAEPVRHQLVRPMGEEFLFAHALIQEGVYASLLTRQRRELHRRAALWFAGRDAVLEAEHLDRAGDPAAARAYLAAARAQAAVYRTERAVQLVARGLALAADPADVHALTLFKGELLHDRGAIAESLAAYERALAVAADDAGRCRAWLGLAAGMRMTDRYEEAFAALDRAEPMAIAAGLGPELARLHHLRGNLHFPLGRLDDCRHEHEAALAAARSAGLPELEARALGGLGDAEYVRGRMVTAHGHFRECVDLARRLGLGRIEVANLAMLGWTRWHFDPSGEVLDEGQAAVAAAARVGHQRAEVIALGLVGLILLQTGAYERALPQIERHLSVCRGLGAGRFEAQSLLMKAEALRALGERAEAVRILRDALALSRQTGFGFIGPAILGALALALDAPDEQRAVLREGEEALNAGAVSHNHFFFRRDAVEVMLALGDWRAVEHHAAALADYTRPEPLVWTQFHIERARVLAAVGSGRRDAVLAAELERLRAEALRLGLAPALPALDRALAAAAAAPGAARRGR
ncbi:adenylate/guanylate cyclase domain-containing protein [Chelatococcus sp. SYSU_G07232]|uniref:Adenylate/guanylate cyclase domain-containing protein n=1 Tax=Chelatococcus albus TaxID=3047466 RepID=A0ABT7AKL1_9HYPH|nr:adenylate/guanylate cyclase domain-containing protein [Chelatococcus sp. SYSU_G07232]MDJ1159517.1 adenylate/guanylate cyclase domain-containing protein [Chelatococcus sp. SYSU_G07232]